MPDSMDQSVTLTTSLLILVLGWALGLFSPLAHEWIRKPFRRRELKQALCTELKGIRHQMVGASHILGMKSQQIDRAFIEWELNLTREYGSKDPDEIFTQGLLEQILNLEDSQFSDSMAQFAARLPESKGYSLKHYRLYLLESKMQEISSLELPYQNKLFEIKYMVDCINEEIDVTMKFHDRTFDSSLTKVNYDRVVAQVQTKHGELHQMMVRTVNKITDLIKVSDTG